jgi:hypothetical protein
MFDPLMSALSGRDPAALIEDASLATPLTAPRITGRDAGGARRGHAPVRALVAWAELVETERDVSLDVALG